MAEELRTVLTVIGVLLIGGIFGHGIWSIRKNKEQLQDYKKADRNEPGFGGKSPDKEGLDLHGVGKPQAKGGETKPERSDPVINVPEVDEPSQQIEPTLESVEPEIKTPEPQAKAKPKVNARTPAEPAKPSEVLIIHVSMPDNQTISGASLLPQLVSMGFKFGEMDIFHRHENSAGTGPILFSLASMYNPGTFDIDNMEQLATKGLSLFMSLPGEGEALQNFNMMHNAAKKVSEEFGGQILDSHRSVMTVQTVRHYVEKIREFERKQLING
jgi:cell division protein ZipA